MLSGNREPLPNSRLAELTDLAITRKATVVVNATVAAALNVSPRQLYRAFDAEVGMSPARYLRHYLLTRARLDLLAADPAEMTVTSIAHASLKYL